MHTVEDPTIKATISVRVVTVIEAPAFDKAYAIFSLKSIVESIESLILYQYDKMTNISSTPNPINKKGNDE